jgi:hypothetical protein
MCECVKKVDEQLAPKNARIGMAMGISPDMNQLTSRLLVATEKIDKKSRKPVPFVVATFCPFCGVKWGEI